jgi:putative component of toxin-antitoxin plasmid stabilization module
MAGKRKKRTTDPEKLARWAEQRRMFEAWLDARLRETLRLREAEAARRARLRRLTFGVFGRS